MDQDGGLLTYLVKWWLRRTDPSWCAGVLIDPSMEWNWIAVFFMAQWGTQESTRTYLLSICYSSYLPIYLSTYLPIYTDLIWFHLSTYLPLPTYLSIHLLSTYFSLYLHFKFSLEVPQSDCFLWRHHHKYQDGDGTKSQISCQAQDTGVPRNSQPWASRSTQKEQRRLHRHFHLVAHRANHCRLGGFGSRCLAAPEAQAAWREGGTAGGDVCSHEPEAHPPSKSLGNDTWTLVVWLFMGNRGNSNNLLTYCHRLLCFFGTRSHESVTFCCTHVNFPFGDHSSNQRWKFESLIGKRLYMIGGHKTCSHSDGDVDLI